MSHTIPVTFHQILNFYSKNGFRVLACAMKLIEVDNVRLVSLAQREEIEKDLIFLGFIIMENKLKPMTPVVIE
jgi:cation-transporting ATPase 13A3/4/5